MKTDIHTQVLPQRHRHLFVRQVVHDRARPSRELHVEICKECHPFFTGEQRIVDTEGRVERFNRRFRMGGR